MKKYLIKRLIFIPITFLGITFIIFSSLNILPPHILAIAYVHGEKELTKEEIDRIIEIYNLDADVFTKYISWLKKTLNGDLGYSFSAKMDVLTAIKTFLPATAELALFSIILIFLVGNYLGIRSAFKKDKTFDKIVKSLTTFFYSMPSFVIGIVVLYIFYGVLGIFKPQRYSTETEILISTGQFIKYSGFMLLDSLINFNFRVLFDSILHLIAPSISIFLATSAVFIKITRTSAIEEFNKDYVRTLKAKGMSNSYIISEHIRKNILIPQITVGGLQLIRLLSGMVITETIFDWPGIGNWGVKAALQLDINGLMGFSLVVSILFLVGNLIIDMLYVLVDPRIRYD